MIFWKKLIRNLSKFLKFSPLLIGWRFQNLFFSFFRSFKTGEGQIIIWKSFRTYLEQVFAKIKILNGVKKRKISQLGSYEMKIAHFNYLNDSQTD